MKDCLEFVSDWPLYFDVVWWIFALPFKVAITTDQCVYFWGKNLHRPVSVLIEGRVQLASQVTDTFPLFLAPRNQHTKSEGVQEIKAEAGGPPSCSQHSLASNYQWYKAGWCHYPGSEGSCTCFQVNSLKSGNVYSWSCHDRNGFHLLTVSNLFMDHLW